MINNSRVEERGGPCSLIKKLFIGYLALVTGCTTTVQQVEQSGKAEQIGRTAYEARSVNAGSASAGQSTGQGNLYNLPELGGAAVKQEPPAKSLDLLNELAGDMPQSAQQDIADPRARGYQDSDAFQNLAAGYVSSASTEAVKKWFSAKNATAELSITAGKDGAKTGSFDLLVPLYDAEKDLIFTQVGIRRSNAHTEDYRSTVNIGAGYRRTVDTWLVGANVFYDRDMTGKNDRLGIGAEAWTDFLKLSANGYIRISDWKTSPDLTDYLERPANGYDLRAEANLPAYPQIGGKLVYEQYFGDQVGLFSAANRQKDPKAVTVGLTYNPVPMIGFGVDYRQGQNGLSETTGKMTLNYQFGVPLSKQLSLAYSVNHRLENTRYNLVSRNNEIVLDYREKAAGQLMLPALAHGTPSVMISFPVTFTDKSIGNFSWSGTAASFALPYGGGGTASVVLPAYDNAGNNLYTLQAIGTDQFGRAIQSNVMQVRVDAFLIALNRSQGSVMANGSDEITFTATLLEPTGEAKQNTPVTWDVQGTADVTDQEHKTDTQGTARLKLTSRFASAVRVTVKEPQGATAENNADFAGDQRTARVIGVVASPQAITANGTATSTLVATIKDANGNAVGAGAPVAWSTSSGSISATSTFTDENSNATVVLIESSDHRGSRHADAHRLADTAGVGMQQADVK
ncbi:inverse autotransporter beta domain-containing protein, partial [Serratia proteamaculans]|uniref:inverse autotransporter beta domain-containing protein n=1 Tax=Serratia proteamaculans TaxID=28151 RepID=UPI003D028097